MTSVSVIIASYRRIERLAACLDGVRAQTRPADEVLAIFHADDEPTANYVAQRALDWPGLRPVLSGGEGSIAAYNAGLRAAESSVVAYIDDDAVPNADWLERILNVFQQDDRIAGVGGRDIVVVDGRVERLVPRRRRLSRGPLIGRIQWFGRMTGNHHLGSGPRSDVDVLKGVNMSFRRADVVGHGFDERLRGRGAVVHSEVSICLPLRRRGLRLVYDPEIVVVHFPAPRPAGDHRRTRDPVTIADSTHNETLGILDYLSPTRRLAYGVWWLAMGSSDSPGAVVMLRDLLAKRPGAFSDFRAAQRGRVSALRTCLGHPRAALDHDGPAGSGTTGAIATPADTRGLTRIPSARPKLLHRPSPSWRSRHVFAAVGLRPAAAQHSLAEARLLKRFARGTLTVVELGVAEGGSAVELRSVMSSAGRLFLVDPYQPGSLGISMARIVARRTVHGVHNGRVNWLRCHSEEAVLGWREPIDFLFIDADHSYERARSDWMQWTPFVRPGGHVALHDSVVFPGGWADEQSGPVRLVGEILAAERPWSVIDQADTLTVLRRAGDRG
jgi:GT2 family glycosyltransferase/predicted O-methyltransferase YrrM